MPDRKAPSVETTTGTPALQGLRWWGAFRAGINTGPIVAARGHGAPGSAPSAVRRQALMQVPRWRLFAGIWCFYLLSPLSDSINTHHGSAREAVGITMVFLFLFLYLGLVPRIAFVGKQAPRWALVVAMLAVVLAFTAAIRTDSALNFTSFFAVSLVMLLDRRHALVAVPLLAVGTAIGPWLFGSHTHFTFGLVDLVVGAAVFAMRARGEADAKLMLANEEIGHLAAEQERLRISRDLHDLLGHALTTITVKAELASKLVERDPQRAAREMAEVAELTRQGLADVRAAVAGYREVSLATELASAREVLHAAGIEAELPPATEAVPGELRELFGWVVREGVTNAVRHSGARHVRVILGPREIQIVDDGPGPVAAPAGQGSGLRGLTERVAALGGRVETGPDPAGAQGFRLRVEVPA